MTAPRPISAPPPSREDLGAASHPPELRLRAIFARSLGWMGAARALAVVGGLFRYLVFARLLAPLDFGIFGAAAVAEAFLSQVTNLNLEGALVPHQGEVGEYLDTVWTTALVQGAVATAILIVLAHPLAHFFRIDNVSVVFVALAPDMILIGAKSPATTARIYRDLDFRISAILSVAELIASFAVGVVAILRWGDWRGLIAAAYAGQLARAALTYRFYPYRPRLRFDLVKARRLFQFGRWMTMRRLTQFLVANLDHIAVGHFLGPQLLGEYQLAYKLGQLPTKEVATAAGLVAFPLVRKVDKRGMHKLFLATNGLVAAGGIVSAAILLLWGRQLVPLIFGAKWLGAVPSLQLLGVFAMFAGFIVVGTGFFDGLNVPSSSFKIVLVSAILLAVFVVPLTIWFGIVGTAAAVVISGVLPVPWMLKVYRDARESLK